MKLTGFWQRVLMGLLVLVMTVPVQVFAQDAASAFRQEELDQMLAPVALYPDSLLAQILMASTYPLEVVLADRWVKQNVHLRGDALNDALDLQSWDPSVKALVPFPDILSMMSERIDWTQRLGEAFLAQEADVMYTIQELRAKAYAAGNLRSSSQQTVSREGTTIIVQPASPHVVYVPVYDPLVVYGPWWWPLYLPYVVHRHPANVVISSGVFWWGVGVTVGAFWGHGWGYWDWGHRRIYVNVNRTININRPIIVRPSEIRTKPWQHNHEHRRGVAYQVPAIRDRFAPINRQAVDYRRGYRGFEQVPPPLTGTGVRRPAAVTRPDKEIARQIPQTQRGAAVVTQPSSPAKPLPGVSRSATATRPDQQIARPSFPVRQGTTAVTKPLPQREPSSRASRPATVTRPDREVARQTPQARPGVTALTPPSSKTKQPSAVSRIPEKAPFYIIEQGSQTRRESARGRDSLSSFKNSGTSQSVPATKTAPFRKGVQRENASNQFRDKGKSRR